MVELNGDDAISNQTSPGKSINHRYSRGPVCTMKYYSPQYTRWCLDLSHPSDCVAEQEYHNRDG